MLSAFVIVLREGFEAFLVVAVILAWLGRSGHERLRSAVYAGIGVSVVVSAGLGVLLRRGAREPLWEGVLALAAIPFIIGLVVHMWRAGPQLRQRMEATLRARTELKRPRAAYLAVFLFTVLMIAREGMETALMLLQVQSGDAVAGAALGALAALGMAGAWVRYGRRIDLRRFFQVTGIFLLLFTVQIAIYALHELSESGLLVNEAVVAFHVATEPYSPYGQYGRWFPLIMVAVPAAWLFAGWLRARHAHDEPAGLAAR